MRAGDLIPLARVDEDIQWHITHRAHARMGQPGQRVQMRIIHAGHERTVTLTLKSFAYPWTYSDALLLLVPSMLLLLGAILAFRGQPNVRTLLTASFLLGVAWGGFGQLLVLPRNTWIVLETVRQMLTGGTYVAGAFLVWTFPSARSVALSRCIAPGVIAAVIEVAGGVMWSLLPLPGHFVTALATVIYVPVFILGLSCIVGFLRSRDDDRRRLRLLALAIVPFAVAVFFKAVLEEIPA